MVEHVAELVLAWIRDDLHIILSIGAGAYLVASQMERRRHWVLRLVLSFVVISLWMMWMNCIKERVQLPGEYARLGALKYGVLFALNVVAVMFYSRGGFFPALFAATVGYSLQHMCERGWEIVRHSFHIPVLLDRVILYVIMLTALYLFGRIVVWNPRGQRFSDFDRLDSKVLLLIAVVVIGVAIVMDLSLFMYTENMTDIVMNYTRATSAIISFLVLVISLCHLREAESEKRAEIADQLLHSEQARFEQDKAIHAAINIKCHDIRHQIAALGEKGYRKELKEIGSLVNIYDTSVRSENTALDVVLSNKSLACFNKGISLTCIADGRQLSFMADEDIYALFGNILDNAIDAVGRITDSERRLISLSVRIRNSFLLIEEENFFEGEMLFYEGLPVTNKEDKLYHGFGMQSIRMLTEKYEGDIHLESEGSIFRLSIMLPMPMAV